MMKKTYLKPMTFTHEVKTESLLYSTSIPTGGDWNQQESKEQPFFEEDDDWGLSDKNDNNLW